MSRPKGRRYVALVSAKVAPPDSQSAGGNQYSDVRCGRAPLCSCIVDTTHQIAFSGPRIKPYTPIVMRPDS